MLAQSHARQPAPPLAARGMWLRLHGGADAFGSALGDAVVGAIADRDKRQSPAPIEDRSERGFLKPDGTFMSDAQYQKYQEQAAQQPSYGGIDGAVDAGEGTRQYMAQRGGISRSGVYTPDGSIQYQSVGAFTDVANELNASGTAFDSGTSNGPNSFKGRGGFVMGTPEGKAQLEVEAEALRGKVTPLPGSSDGRDAYSDGVASFARDVAARRAGTEGNWLFQKNETFAGAHDAVDDLIISNLGRNHPVVAGGLLLGSQLVFGDDSNLAMLATVLPFAKPEALLSERVIGGVAANSEKRGMIFVSENLGEPRNAAMQVARDFESGAPGAFSDIATRQRQVPALRFDNPNPNGASYVKFDGYQTLDDGTIELIDRKTRILTFNKKGEPFIPPGVRDGLTRQSLALSQNPGYTGVIELPTSGARREAQQVLRQLGINNISTRVVAH